MAAARAVEVASEYEEAIVLASHLAWEDRWDAAATAYRRALAVRPGDSFAERQLHCALSRVPATSMTELHASNASAHGRIPVGEPAEAGFSSPDAPSLAELATLPREVVRPVANGLQVARRQRANGQLDAAFDTAFSTLLFAPSFLPTHVLLADLYADSGQWEAAREKLSAIEAASAVAVAEQRRA